MPPPARHAGAHARAPPPAHGLVRHGHRGGRRLRDGFADRPGAAAVRPLARSRPLLRVVENSGRAPAFVDAAGSVVVLGSLRIALLSCAVARPGKVSRVRRARQPAEVSESHLRRFGHGVPCRSPGANEGRGASPHDGAESEDMAPAPRRHGNRRRRRGPEDAARSSHAWSQSPPTATVYSAEMLLAPANAASTSTRRSFGSRTVRASGRRRRGEGTQSARPAHSWTRNSPR